MSEPDVQLHPDIRQFLSDLDAYRAAGDPAVTDEKLQASMTAWEQDFTARNGVGPSRDQRAERRRTLETAYVETVAAADAQLEARHAAMRADLMAAVRAAENLPDAVTRADHARRAEPADAPPCGLTRTSSCLCGCWITLRRPRSKPSYRASSFPQLEAIHEQALLRQDATTLAVVERLAAEGWPGVVHDPKTLSSRQQLEARIRGVRAARVPASVAAGLQALEQAWQNRTLQDLRRIRKEQLKVVR